MNAASARTVVARIQRRKARAADWVRRRRRRVHEPQGIVLMYHRVAAAPVDPWRLAVTPQHFEDQLRVLRQRADIVPLAELHSQLRHGRWSRPVMSITFDDGYLDNLDVARPLLERFETPATVFVATGYVGGSGPFWWDRLADACLGVEALPRRLELTLGACQFLVEDPELTLPGPQGRRARRRLHDGLWERLVSAQASVRDRAIAELERWAGAQPSADSRVRPMNAEELGQLVAGGLVDLGAHTVTHPLLSRLPTDQKAAEIDGSRRDCAKWAGRAPRAFAFPNGDLDEESVDCVRRAGFELACTSRQDLVWASGDLFQVPRISVRNEGGEALWRRLRWQWLP
jgi:peptidoglycan/xylan/chitin deacetylase (PgdA/CDA1 family)